MEKKISIRSKEVREKIIDQLITLIKEVKQGKKIKTTVSSPPTVKDVVVAKAAMRLYDEGELRTKCPESILLWVESKSIDDVAFHIWNANN